MISTPQIGFARGHYTRKRYNGTSYEGVIEKRIFALMNEARYPMTVGKVEIAPTVEFNAIAYNTKGSEDEKAYAAKYFSFVSYCSLITVIKYYPCFHMFCHKNF